MITIIINNENTTKTDLMKFSVELKYPGWIEECLINLGTLYLIHSVLSKM